jgi:hypothetical protein
MKIIELTISAENPLSKQLMEITGDSFNVWDFKMIADEPLNAGKNKPFIHIASGQIFKIIN